MEINKGIRAKIFFLFVIMGAVPFLILITAGAINTISELEESDKQNGLLRNVIISEHITELISKNQAVLKSLAMSPTVIRYLQQPTDTGKEYVRKILHDADEIFADGNLTALTGADGWQIIRTDNATLVNLKKRQHFQEAMKGRAYVSDIISSMSTGKMVIVIETPVLDATGKPIGMIQRNFDLAALQDFAMQLDDSEVYVVVMDRTGRIIVNSDTDGGIGISSDYAIDNSYKFILDRIYNSKGVIRIDINGEDSLATYSRNLDTGWMIVTIRPYHYIMDKVYDKAAKAVIFGMVMLFVGTLAAYLLTIRVTKPIVEMTEVVDKIVSGEAPAEKIEVSSDDELGQMAAAFNKIRSERDAYQLESELDKLTELFNKKTMENLCKMKLKTFNENENSNIFMAFYVIDLDHFKEVNDLLGHQFGDRVLVEFAKGLRKIFRPNDCIGRFGGDEFVVIVDSLPNMEVVIRKAEQIKQIAFNLSIDGKGHFVTASIGIAIAPQNGRDYDSLFASADKAVYHVKNNGKNGYYCELFANEDDDD
ncbi:MAG: diguanylate cyclase [Selenomonadaceae bacterium]|nr:diguanylate cyclase [Selenomonadaceae bacterium]MBQ7723352.1 diguanylate cyclase [Selenomonadaceae bacterium]